MHGVNRGLSLSRRGLGREARNLDVGVFGPFCLLARISLDERLLPISLFATYTLLPVALTLLSTSFNFLLPLLFRESSVIHHPASVAGSCDGIIAFFARSQPSIHLGYVIY